MKKLITTSSFILSILLTSCTATPPKKISPEELNSKIDTTVVDLVRPHKKFGGACDAVNQEVQKTKTLNEKNGTSKKNDFFNYTTGIQIFLLKNYSLEFQVSRTRRLLEAYKQVELICQNNPNLSYPDALQSVLDGSNS